MLSALWVSHSHHDSSAALELDGGALVDVDTDSIPFEDVSASSIPDADAIRLANEPNEVVARDHEVVARDADVSTGSAGTSFGRFSGSE